MLKLNTKELEEVTARLKTTCHINSSLITGDRVMPFDDTKNALSLTYMIGNLEGEHKELAQIKAEAMCIRLEMQREEIAELKRQLYLMTS
tara:strand:+ start:10737 stop:11006 length:270 start_codon:yes stop_codon:yes gene_type:complete